MYPSRSERKKAKMKAKQTSQLRLWTFINLGLIIVIAFLLIYHFAWNLEDTDTLPSLYEPNLPDSSKIEFFKQNDSFSSHILIGKAYL